MFLAVLVATVSFLVVQCSQRGKNNLVRERPKSRNSKSTRSVSSKRSSRRGAKAKSGRSSRSAKATKASNSSKKSRSQPKSSKKSVKAQKSSKTSEKAVPKVDTSKRTKEVDDTLASSQRSKKVATKIHVEPEALKFKPTGGFLTLEVTNESNQARPFKVKCSDRLLYSVNTAEGQIGANSSTKIQVLRENGGPKYDKLVIFFENPKEAGESDVIVVPLLVQKC